MNKPSNTTKTNLKNKVFACINEQQLEPRPRWHFWCGECATIVLWALSVVVGAIAVAIIIYSAGHTAFSLFEASHETLFAFAVEVLPYAWMLIFVVMAALAYVNFRQTCTGYRYSALGIVASSVAFSVVGGAGLHVAGFSAILDAGLSPTLPMTQSMEQKEERLWLEPKDGRLVGTFKAYQPASSTATFLALNGTEWVVDTSVLDAADLELLQSEAKVRLIGVQSTTTPDMFMGCGVFPWMYGSIMPLTDMQKERQAFLKRLYAKKELATQSSGTASNTANKQVVSMIANLCARHTTTKRIEAAMP